MVTFGVMGRGSASQPQSNPLGCQAAALPTGDCTLILVRASSTLLPWHLLQRHVPDEVATDGGSGFDPLRPRFAALVI